MRIEEVLARLAAVRPNGERSWMARCPAHDDRNPSLSVSEGDKTRSTAPPPASPGRAQSLR